MSQDFNLRSREYWQRLGWGLIVGLLSAIGAFIFIGLMNLGQSLIWPDLTDWTPFSGPWQMVVIMTVAGILVGLIHHFTSAAQLDVFAAVAEGDMDPKPVYPRRCWHPWYRSSVASLLAPKCPPECWRQARDRGSPGGAKWTLKEPGPMSLAVFQPPTPACFHRRLRCW
jgi:hypothetical protein